jgi:hypothetical protein
VDGAQVRLDSGQSTVSHNGGAFSISGVLPGVHDVEALLVGYQPARAAGVTVTQELTITVRLNLTERTVTPLGSVTVRAPMVRQGVTPTLHTLTRAEEDMVRSGPDLLHQYAGALVTQPGVVPDADGHPAIRGARQTEVGYMVNGILITEPSTGGFATNLVTVGLDRMNLYTGGYRAELGSAAGGMVNAVLRTGASIRGAAMETTLGGWNYAGATYEQGNVERDGLNWYVAGNVFQTGFQRNRQVAGLPVSADGLVRLVKPLGAKDRLDLLYIGGYERYEFPVEDPLTGLPWAQGAETPGYAGTHTWEFDDAAGTYRAVPAIQDNQAQGHHIGSLTWNHALGAGTRMSLQAYGWNRRIDDNELSPWSLFDYRQRDRLLGTRWDVVGTPSAALTWRVGGELIQGWNFNRSLLGGIPRDPAQPDVVTNAGRFVRDADTTDGNAYTSLTWKRGARWTADLGLRYDSRAYHRRITDAAIALGTTGIAAADREVLAETGRNPRYDAVSPRLGLAFSPDARTVIRLSGGRFAQFAPSNFIERQYIPTENYEGGGNVNSYARRFRKVFDVRPEIADGVDIGIEREVSAGLRLSVTPYWRTVRHMFDYGATFDAQGQPLEGPGFGNVAHGHTVGVETQITLRDHNGLGGWLTYTWQDARGNTTASIPGSGLADPARPNAEHRRDYDQRHTISLVARYREGAFEVNPMLELGSGYPWGGTPGGWYSTNNGGVTFDNRYAFAPGTMEKAPVLVNGRLQSLDVNPYNTGWHSTLSVTFRYYADRQRTTCYFLQVRNILNSDDVTGRAIFDKRTGAPMGYVPGEITYTDENGVTRTAPGHFEYKPSTRTAPPFFMIGVRKDF